MKLTMRIGKKLPLISVELCALQGFASGIRDSTSLSRYWKDIAPQNRKSIHPKIRKRKKRKIEENITASNCKNPFHFLRRHRNLSKKRPRKCPCSTVPITEIPNQRITTFFQVSVKPLKIPVDPTFFISRTDKIREQHDRGKRRVSHFSLK